MVRALVVETSRAASLTPLEGGAWAAFAAASPVGGPFLSLDYARLAETHAPRSGVAVIRRNGRAVGFLPFQRRGFGLQPLAAPLTDYHGLIAEPGAEVEVAEVLRALRVAAFGATAWVGEAPAPLAGLLARRRMTVDLSAGLDGWRKLRASDLKDKGRRGRALARDYGEPTLHLADSDPAALDWLFAQKRAQYRDTAQHDVFSCGWTGRLLRALVAERTGDFGARVATLRLQGQLVAAELVLDGAGVSHLWFPAYDRAFARYSPGVLLLLEILAGAAAEGRETVDFGPDVEGYKAAYADPGALVHEGVLRASPLRGGLDATVPAPTLARLRRKAERRLAVIRGCEPNALGAATVSAQTLVELGMRRLVTAVHPTLVGETLPIAGFSLLPVA